MVTYWDTFNPAGYYQTSPLFHYNTAEYFDKLREYKLPNIKLWANVEAFGETGEPCSYTVKRSCIKLPRLLQAVEVVGEVDKVISFQYEPYYRDSTLYKDLVVFKKILDNSKPPK